MTPRLVLPARPDADARAVIDHGLGAFNDAVPALADVHALEVFAYDDLDAVVGGAVGRTWGECCELMQLWVHGAHRRHGLGRALVARFEAAAGRRGCRLAYLETWSFQAPGFYEKLGYHPALVTRGYTGGTVRYTLHKRLQGDTP
jgi:GNAT superfamily N-acetyltransferase